MPTPNFHLFSTPGKDDLRYILEASRPYLEGKEDAMVAYLPLASLYIERWQELTAEAFLGLARLQTINTELMRLPEMESILREARLVYIPGGNTFLLNHRLHISGLMPYLKKKVLAGLPLVAFSAGTILCGPNILTSKDMNSVGTPHFDGLGVSAFNFKTHYPLDEAGQSVMDDWLGDYQFFNDNPIVMMTDGAYVKSAGRKIVLVRGEAWIMRHDREKQRLEEGQFIA
jgi:dipeptidase E